jgi:hypothetical protein
LTLVGVHFEAILQFSLFGVIWVLIPENLRWIDWENYLFAPDLVSNWLHHLSSLAAMSLIAPFYVAGGFSLYLTRRSQLEAWDLELGLRQLAQRHPPRPGLRSYLLTVCFGFLLAGITLPKTSDALELDSQQAEATIQEVLKDEAFGQEEDNRYWQYIGDKEDKEETIRLGKIAEIIAKFVEFLMWMLVAGLIAYLIYWYVQKKSMLSIPTIGKRNRSAPNVVAGLDLRPETLPDEPATEAARLIEQEHQREGLALLYRATLSELIHRYDLPICEGDTEGECLQKSHVLRRPTLSNYFSELTDVWLLLAYAHRQQDKDQLLAFCQLWRDHFKVHHAE